MLQFPALHIIQTNIGALPEGSSHARLPGQEMAGVAPIASQWGFCGRVWRICGTMAGTNRLQGRLELPSRGCGQQERSAVMGLGAEDSKDE